MIISNSQFIETVQQEKAKGEIVVATDGCFDILHIGHLRYLQEAQKLGTLLVVSVLGDTSVRRLKGSGRPIICEDQRAEMLLGLKSVAYVTIVRDARPTSLICELRAHFYVKGGDYTLETLPGREVLEKNCGEIVFLPITPSVSTTNIVRRIRETDV